MKRAIIAGCGLSGSVVARYLAEKLDYKVTIFERRNHIGGNMYDYVNEDGILIHQYGPHTFHTKKKELYDYICQYGRWEEYHLTCGAIINGKYTPTPFNFQTIDDFYPAQQAEAIKNAIRNEYPERQTATVLELLKHKNPLIREFAQFLFDNDYSLYTAKQWGISPEEIDPGVLKRVPIRFSYEEGAFDDVYQALPKESYTGFFQNLLQHPNISIVLGVDIRKQVNFDLEYKQIFFDGDIWNDPFIYTGAIDELFGNRYGELPYRSLRFEWRTEAKKSFQNAPVVAYPQAPDFTRITEYTKLPLQEAGEKTCYAMEFPLPYKAGKKMEPYYPIPSRSNDLLYQKYKELAGQYPNLYLCGRLADYKYYNMDQALERALELCWVLEKNSRKRKEC